jgi:hypothetical protein
MCTAIAMKHPVRLLTLLASALVLAAPLAPSHALGEPGHGLARHQTGHQADHRAKHRGKPAKQTSSRASAWTIEDPSFPFRWETCDPIPYRVNLGGTSHRNLVVLRSALDQIAEASGFTFQYAGSTSVVPFHKGHDTLDQVPDDGLYVAWTTAGQVPRLAGNVIGLGGPGVSYHRVGTEWQVTSGGVAIDRTTRLSTALDADGPTLKSLLLHELGHAMGLGHSRSKANVMYEGLGSWSRPVLGPGDRAGLRDLGASC